MPNKVKEINVAFSIRNIQTLKFVIDNIKDAEKFDKQLYQFEISIASALNDINKLLSIDTIIDIYADKDKSIKVSELITRIEFYINNFEDIFIKEDDKINFPDALMYNFIGIAVSTTRGILAAKTEGSIIKDIFLPVVNPTKFQMVAPVNKG